MLLSKIPSFLLVPQLVWLLCSFLSVDVATVITTAEAFSLVSKPGTWHDSALSFSRQRQQQQQSHRNLWSSPFHDSTGRSFPTTTTTALGSSSSPPSSSSSSSTTSSSSKKTVPWTLVGVATWFVSLSYLIVINYKVEPWIPFLLTTTANPAAASSVISKRGWVLIHAISNMFFTGGIVLSTLFEWMIVSSHRRSTTTSTNNDDTTTDASSSSSSSATLIYHWFTQVSSRIDKWIVLPALTLSIVAGFAQTALDYGSMAAAPKHIRRAVHVLATFALWWLTTDLGTTQRRAERSVTAWYNNNRNDTNRDQSSLAQELPKVLYARRWSNVVSCSFVMGLYALMALKPGYYGTP